MENSEAVLASHWNKPFMVSLYCDLEVDMRHGYARTLARVVPKNVMKD